MKRRRRDFLRDMAAAAAAVAAWAAPAAGQLAIPPRMTPKGPKAAPLPPAAVPAVGVLPAPSENKGRAGTYEAKTSHAGYNYHVYVPKGYGDAAPAGLHLFFHGQGGGKGAPHFGQWSKHFLEPCNLIGINMQYTDGDNAKDTGGKVDAAVEALRQVMADYKIVAGRGAVGSFSGGGLPHERLLAKFGKVPLGSPSPCPFNHSSLYGSNYWADPTGCATMSWFVGVGTKEWNMGMPTLGTSQTKRAEQLLQAALRGGPADVHFKVTKDKGHTIGDADVRDSAALFARSQLAFAPFLYEPDYAAPALAGVARQANTLALGRASAAIEKALADPKLDAAAKPAAEDLKAKIGGRIDAALAMTRQLVTDDVLLAVYYGNLLAQQLGTHAKAADLKAAVAEARKSPAYTAHSQAFAEFVSKFRNLFQGAGLASGAEPFLESLKTRAAATSLLGKMAAEILTMGGP